MSLAIASKSSGTGPGAVGDVTVTKPTGLAVGDLMIAFITSSAIGTSEEAHAGPTGWTLLDSVTPDNGEVLTAWGVIATSTQTAASDFTWTSGGSNRDTIGTIFRITSTVGFSSLSALVDSTAGTAGVTTLSFVNILLIAGAIEGVDNDPRTFSGYAVANNNPTWTEEYDLNVSNAGSTANMGVASAQYPYQQATGTVSVTGSPGVGSPERIIVAVGEAQNIAVTGTTGVINLQGIEGSVTAGASVTGTTGNLNLVGNEGTIATSNAKWTNVAKTNTSPTITNVAKS